MLSLKMGCYHKDFKKEENFYAFITVLETKLSEVAGVTTENIELHSIFVIFVACQEAYLFLFHCYSTSVTKVTILQNVNL